MLVKPALSSDNTFATQWHTYNMLTLWPRPLALLIMQDVNTQYLFEEYLYQDLSMYGMAIVIHASIMCGGHNDTLIPRDIG